MQTFKCGHPRIRENTYYQNNPVYIERCRTCHGATMRAYGQQKAHPKMGLIAVTK